MDIGSLNVIAECRRYRVGIWACPQFLFIVMGALIIVAMFATFALANRYSGDPAVAVGSVSGVTAIFFAIGQMVVASFDRLANASRQQAEFVSVISHQLRTPLSAVRWQLGLIREKLNKGKHDIMPVLDVTEEQTGRAIKLVSAMLEVNRIEERRSAMHITPVSLWKATETALTGYVGAAEKLGLTLTAERETESDAYAVEADELKLSWVLENLIDNALKYSSNGGHVWIRLRKTRGKIEWEIEDEGAGIPAYDQGKIFQKFFRADNAMKAQTEGSGLGLFIVRSFVRAMGGDIAFVSYEGKGSKFYFTLIPVRGS